MIKIAKLSKEDVMACGYVPDPHTVTLKDDGEWYALGVDDKWVTFVCIRPRGDEMHIREVFTVPEYRRRGYLYKLVSYVVDVEYAGYQISVHALRKSRDCFKKCGFKEFSFRHFKYGDQWWLRRPGEKLSEISSKR